MTIQEGDIKSYLMFDTPVPYKGLNIRCPKVREYYEFYTYTKVFEAEKDDPAMLVSPEDAALIKDMDFLSFLFYLGTNNKLEPTTERPYLFLLDKLLKLVCDLPATKNKTDKEGTVVVGKDNTPVLEGYISYDSDPQTAKGSLIIDRITYDGEDIDNILSIIGIQNGVDLVDYSKTKELRDILNSALTFKSKVSGGTKSADFENQITALATITGWKIEDIYDLSIRKFRQAMARVDKFETWKIFTLASMMGFVKFPPGTKGLEHWTADLTESDKYDSVTSSIDSLTKKVTGEEALDKAKDQIEKLKKR